MLRAARPQRSGCIFASFCKLWVRTPRHGVYSISMERRESAVALHGTVKGEARHTFDNYPVDGLLYVDHAHSGGVARRIVHTPQ